ncbi:ROK family protein, partial [Streptomyces sp. SID335]|nr:ROK family protein [Streptomyces sp. SID335]
ALRDYATLSFVRRLTVAPALMGTDAGLVGAAAAALDLEPSAAARLTAPAAGR